MILLEPRCGDPDIYQVYQDGSGLTDYEVYCSFGGVIDVAHHVEFTIDFISMFAIIVF